MWRRTPPYPPLILGSGAGLGQKCGEVVPGGWRGFGEAKEAPEARGAPGEVRGVCGKGREREGRVEGAEGGEMIPVSVKLL